MTEMTHEAPQGSRWGSGDGGGPRRVVHEGQLSKTPTVVIRAHGLRGAFRVQHDVKRSSAQETQRDVDVWEVWTPAWRSKMNRFYLSMT